LLKRAGIREIRWRDVRHTYATQLLTRGVHPKYVQQLLGHTSIQLTSTATRAGYPSMSRDAVDSMDEALGKSLLLTKPSIFASEAFHFYVICKKNKEPTSGLEALSCSSYECLLAIWEQP
jgi:Phage integrase family